MGAVGKGAMGSVLDAVAPGIGFVDAHARLEVAQVVSTLGVAGGSVQEHAAEGVGEPGLRRFAGYIGGLWG